MVYMPGSLEVKKSEWDGLVEAINTYYSSPEKYNNIKSNCIQSITEKFTWEAVTNKIVKHF